MWHVAYALLSCRFTFAVIHLLVAARFPDYKRNRACACFIVSTSSTLAAIIVLIQAPLSSGQGTDATASVLPKRLIADYGYWSRTQTPPYSSDQIPFQKLTHINHAGVNFDAGGNLTSRTDFWSPISSPKAINHGVQVIALAGRRLSGTRNFHRCNSQSRRESEELHQRRTVTTASTSIGNIRAPISTNKPSSTLMLALRNAFPRSKYILSADVPPWGPPQYDYPQVTPLVDYYNLLTFDCAGPWTDDAQFNSPIFPDPNNPEPYECEPGGSIKEAIDIYLKQLNIPPAKLNIATPFYGYFYKNVSALYGPCKNCGNSVLTENYGTFIKQRINKKGWTSILDQVTLVPYMLRSDGSPGFITYDDPNFDVLSCLVFRLAARPGRKLDVVARRRLRRQLAGSAGRNVPSEPQTQVTEIGDMTGYLSGLVQLRTPQSCPRFPLRSIKQILPPLIVALGKQPHQMPAGVQTKRPRRSSQLHARFIRRPAALAIIAGMAARHQILPGSLARARSRNHVIQRQFAARHDAMAILTRVTVAHQNVLPRQVRASDAGCADTPAAGSPTAPARIAAPNEYARATALRPTPRPSAPAPARAAPRKC